MIKLLVDSAADYPVEELKAKGIALCPMTVNFGQDSYIEGQNLDRDTFYQLLTEGTHFPKTSQPSPQAFLEIFERVKADGDEMICVLISSVLSGTVQSAKIAKEMVDYDGIYIVDSHSATCCIKVLVDNALQLVEEGLSAKKIVERLEALRSRIKVIAMVDTLEYLAKGGRLSKAAAAVGELAKIKPVITLADDGSIEVIGKCLGKIKAMNFMLKRLEKVEMDAQFPVYTVYTYGVDNLEKFESKFALQGIHSEASLQIGATIGTHVGPGVFGVIYVEK